MCAFVIAFGNVIEDLRTVPDAFTYLGRAVLSDIKILQIYETNPAMGAALIFLFYVMVRSYFSFT